jgi:alanine racemase
MDSISIDLGKESSVKVGQRVEVFGPKSKFSIFDAAQRLGIQTGEIALRLSERAEVILCR